MANTQQNKRKLVTSVIQLRYRVIFTPSSTQVQFYSVQVQFELGSVQLRFSSIQFNSDLIQFSFNSI